MENQKPIVLIIDETSDCIDIVTNVLSKNYLVKAATSGERGIFIAQQSPKPDLILLDVVMPQMDGFEVCKNLKKSPLTSMIPVILLTAQLEDVNEQLGFDIGAVDYITKPISPAIVRARVSAQISAYNLKKQVKEKLTEIAANQLEITKSLARAAGFKDNETGMHVIRMSHYSYLLSKAIGANDKWCNLLFEAAPMHDIGKIGIPDSILLKPGRLDENETLEMQKHVGYGVQILGDYDSPLLNLAREVVLGHHEKWDGSGYPNSLSGEAIPLSARIVAIADVFDALTSERPYKKAWSIEKSSKLLAEQAGYHFDPNLVSIFLELMPQIIKIMARYSDTKGTNPHSESYEL